MSEKTLPFVITDRRKFNTDGEPRPDAAVRDTAQSTAVAEMPSREIETEPERPVAAAVEPASTITQPETTGESEADLPPAPSLEEMEQSRIAFNATADRLDTAIRAANPGGEHPPAMSFEQLIQSVYMQAILQLGGGTQQGQQPQVDLLGARQSIDMLGILDEKTRGNLTEAETSLLSSALFELRLAFLEITQAIARQAQQRGSGGPGGPAGRVRTRPARTEHRTLRPVSPVMDATLTFLGTGTSMGVPTLGCACAVCRSAIAPEGDPRNRRTRPSIRLEYNDHVVLIDTGPDFHAQALREGITHVDAVFYTHAHADHILGMDDLRPAQLQASRRSAALRRCRNSRDLAPGLRVHLSHGRPLSDQRTRPHS